MVNLTKLTARKAAAQIKAKALSAQALMAATLDQIDAINPSVNAIVALRDRDALMAEAQAADLAADQADSPLGPLHGIPIAIKDLVETKGIASTSGSPLLANYVPTQDHLLAQRVKDAGAIVIGKTNTPEFGLGSNTFNPVYGATGNAYDTSRTCGGSSGGAAVALATRMLLLADGSDMMGSLRNPAAWNNVYGMRPSHGLVPDHPRGDMFLHPLATLGPMARDPLDLAMFLETLAGPTAHSPQGQEFDASKVAALPDLRGKRIGWLGDWGGAFPYDDGITTACEAGLEVLRQLGADVVPVAPPFDAETMFDAWSVLRSWAISAGLRPLWEDPEKRQRLKTTAEWEVARGQSFSALQVHQASEVASDWYRRAGALFAAFDAMVLPTAQVWPFSINEEYPTEIAGRSMDTYHRWMQVVVPISLIGLPAISLPVGFGAQGLPMGMQIFGPRGADAALLSMAATYHTATDWPNQHPPAF